MKVVAVGLLFVAAGWSAEPLRLPRPDRPQVVRRFRETRDFVKEARTRMRAERSEHRETVRAYWERRDAPFLPQPPEPAEPETPAETTPTTTPPAQ